MNVCSFLLMKLFLMFMKSPWTCSQPFCFSAIWYIFETSLQWDLWELIGLWKMGISSMVCFTILFEIARSNESCTIMVHELRKCIFIVISCWLFVGLGRHVFDKLLRKDFTGKSAKPLSPTAFTFWQSWLKIWNISWHGLTDWFWL